MELFDCHAISVCVHVLQKRGKTQRIKNLTIDSISPVRLPTLNDLGPVVSIIIVIEPLVYRLQDSMHNEFKVELKFETSSPDQLHSLRYNVIFLVFFRIITLIGYEPNEVIGKTAYYFHNPLDAPRVSDCHSNRKYIFFSPFTAILVKFCIM